MDGDQKIVAVIIWVAYLLASLAMVVTTAIVTKSDPTDPAIYLERAY